MLFKSIIKRFFSIQFGRSLNEDDLYLVFKNCLEKIHQDDIMILNNPSYFYDYIDCGIRSQKSWYSSLYILIYLQIIALTVFSIIKFSVIHLVIFLCMILLQYIFCWIAISIDRQYQFIDRVMNWSLDLSYDLDLVNYLMVDSGFSVRNSKPFEQDKYAKIWLKEMSTSMDMEWESIVIELLPGKNVFVPKIRVSLGGNKKTIQDASVYGFTDKNDDQIPNDLLKTLMLLSREKSIQFFGSTKESKFINNSIGRLNHHLILLFGKRKYDPIVFDKSKQRWVSLIKLIDRSNTDRNDMKQSIKIFNKILNTYTGSHRLI